MFRCAPGRPSTSRAVVASCSSAVSGAIRGVIGAHSNHAAATARGRVPSSAMPSAPPPRNGILAGPLEAPARLAASFPSVEATPGLRVLHRASGFRGALVALDGDQVVLHGQTGLERRFPNQPGGFAVDGAAPRLVAAHPRGGQPHPRISVRARLATDRTASGSRAVVGAQARVARAARILVEGVHDAELVERVWGDDLRIEGVVVERLDGADHLAAVLAELRPGPQRRVGVLLDHLVSGSKEARLAATSPGLTC